MAGPHAFDMQSGAFRGCAYTRDGFLMQRRFSHDAPAANISAVEFKLRLHQNQEIPQRAPAAATTAGSTLATEMNETSMVTRSGGSGIWSARRLRALALIWVTR